MTQKTVILDLFDAMKQQNIICAYHGDFNYEVVNGILKTAKYDLENSDVDRKAAKKTYKVLVECLENIHKHAKRLKTDGDDSQINEGIFVLTCDPKGYSIKVGNLVQKEEVDPLKERIDEANAMDRDELKSKYREIIRGGSISDKGGAGLGIIDISLKAENKLEYQFHDYKNNLIFFTLSIDIDFQTKEQ